MQNNNKHISKLFLILEIIYYTFLSFSNETLNIVIPFDTRLNSKEFDVQLGTSIVFCF